MKLKSKTGMRGMVNIYSLPPDFTYEDFKKCDKEKYLVDRGENLVVDMGLRAILNLMTGQSTSYFNYCGVGSGTTAAAADDTDIETAIGSRVAVNDSWRGGLSGYWYTFFDKNTCNGTWTESVIANASSGGDILCRRKFISSFVKSTSNAGVVEWVITATGTADS